LLKLEREELYGILSEIRDKLAELAKQKAKVKFEEKISRKFTPFQEEPYQSPSVRKNSSVKKYDIPSKEPSELPMPQDISIDFCLTSQLYKNSECAQIIVTYYIEVDKKNM
ncbi:8029_t:CDS:1, partial [Gigaspora rosea]